MVFHISDLVQLTALDHRVIEHIEHRRAQRLGPVDPDEHRTGDVQAPLPQVHQQPADQRGVLRRALHQRQRVLGALDVNAHRDDTAGLGEVHAVDHQRHQIQPGQIGRQQLGQGGFGHRHKSARDRRFACRRRLFIYLPADRLKPDRVAASRQAGQHPLQRHLAQQLRRAEQLIRGDRHLPGPVGGPHPRAGDRHPPATQGHRPTLTPVPHRHPHHVVPALRPGQCVHVGLHQRRHHLQARTHGQGQQPLVHALGDLTHRHTDPLRDGGHARAHRLVLATLLHGGPLLLVFLAERPTPTTRQVSSGGPPPQLLRDPGQPRLRDRQRLAASGALYQEWWS